MSFFNRISRFFRGVFKKKEPVVSEPSPIVVPISEMPWFELAKKEIGEKEQSSGSNPRIVEYHSVTSLEATDDGVPWCASFVSWCLERSGYKSTRSARAKSYLDYGVKLEKPVKGCVVVFSRGRDSGHVAFYDSDAGMMIRVLGGNQSDKVCYSSYLKSRILGYRMPVKKQGS